MSDENKFNESLKEGYEAFNKMLMENKPFMPLEYIYGTGFEDGYRARDAEIESLKQQVSLLETALCEIKLFPEAGEILLTSLRAAKALNQLAIMRGKK